MLQRLLGYFGYERRSLAQPTPEEFALFGSAPTAAGVHVSGSNCLRSPTTLAAVRVISEAMAALPFHVFARGTDGERERERDHPAAKLLGGDFCPWSSAFETKAVIMLDALTHDRGAGYGLVIRVNGQPAEIHRLPPSTVTPDYSGIEPRYKHTQDGVERLYDWRDVLVIATPGSSPDRPLSVAKECREAIGVDIVMAAHQARLFGSAARPGGVLKHPRTIGPEAAKRLKAQFEAAHGGSNSGGTLLLEEGLEWAQTTLSSTDAQFLELRRYACQEIARAFKVPSTLVGDFERAVWSNVEELNRQFVQTCLMPWAEVWQAALERVLLTPAERADIFIEAVFDDLLRADMAARFAAYQSAVGGPWLLPNEARALENRPGVEGGDKLRMQPGQAEAPSDKAPAEPPVPPKPKLEAVA